MIGVRRWRFSTLAAALGVVAAILAPAGSARTGGELPTLYVQYTINCTFSIVDDSGQPVTAIAPGSYQVEVSTPIMFKLVVPGGPGIDSSLSSSNFAGCKGWVQFQLTGPGVSIATTLDTGCDSNLLLPAQTFQPNATYVAQDNNQPSVTRMSFTTTNSGTPTVGTSVYNNSTTGSTQSSIMGGSDSKGPIAGTLAATLSASGQPALMLKGKPVTTLKAGRYKLSIVDKDPKASFTLQTAAGKVKVLTGAAFVGVHPVTMNLTVGQWRYYSGVGKTSSFQVSG